MPHTWLHALPVVSTAMFVPLVEPDVWAPISVAINAASPGSIAARAFVATAKELGLNELFGRTLLCSRTELHNQGLSANRG